MVVTVALMLRNAKGCNGITNNRTDTHMRRTHCGSNNHVQYWKKTPMAEMKRPPMAQRMSMVCV
jgi:hypothetical protein